MKCKCGLDVLKLNPIHRFMVGDEVVCYWCTDMQKDPLFPIPEIGNEEIYKDVKLEYCEESVGDGPYKWKQIGWKLVPVYRSFQLKSSEPISDGS